MASPPPPPVLPPTLRVEEFRALRATIRERGSLRVALASLGLVGWAALHLAVLMWLPHPVTLLVPLLALAVIFEAVFALHVGVERIGRYLESCYESDATDGPRWEHTAHAFGRLAPDSTTHLDGLFSIPFVAATLLNLVPVVLRLGASDQWDLGTVAELAVNGGLHLAFIVRVGRARAFAARQRKDELSVFRQLANGPESN